MAITRARAYDPYDSWSVDSKGREVNALGQHRTIGYSPDRQPSRGFGGLNEHYLRQNNDGSPKALDRAAQALRKSGLLITKDNQRVPDTWENRGFTTHRSGKNPYIAPPAVPGQPKFDPKVSADNKRFAEEPTKRPGPLAGGGAKDEGVVPGQGDGPDAEEGANLDAGEGDGPEEEATDEEGNTAEDIANDLINNKPAPQSSKLPPNPYADAPMLQPGPVGNDNSGAGSEKPSIGDAYPLMDARMGQVGSPDQYTMPPNLGRLPANPYTGLSKTDDGTGTSPYARATLGPGAQEVAARRDFARGEAPVQFTDPNTGPNADEMNLQPIRAEKINPYGTATATYGPKPPTGGTMQDMMGRTVPMNPYLKEQSLVQDTKFGPMTPGAQKPLGQDDAEMYRQIARGGKMPRSKTAA